MKKVYPAFKPSNIGTIRLAQKIPGAGECDIIQMIDGKVITVTSEDLTLFESEYGYLNVEEEMLGHYKCHNVQWQNDYCFCLVDDKTDMKKEQIDALFSEQKEEEDDC